MASRINFSKRIINFRQVYQWQKCRSQYFSSNSNYAGSHCENYLKNIFKKFMFQVHPDYFHGNKQISEINTINLGALRSIVDGDDSGKSRPDARSLTFYIKADDSWNSPKKVKVSTIRAVESMTEILETIGIELPQKPADFDQYLRHKSQIQNNSYYYAWQSSTHRGSDGDYIDNETARILSFLESLRDRKGIIAIREERMNALHQIEKVTISHHLSLLFIILMRIIDHLYFLGTYESNRIREN